VGKLAIPAAQVERPRPTKETPAAALQAAALVAALVAGLRAANPSLNQARCCCSGPVSLDLAHRFCGANVEIYGQRTLTDLCRQVAQRRSR